MMIGERLSEKARDATEVGNIYTKQYSLKERAEKISMTTVVEC